MTEKYINETLRPLLEGDGGRITYLDRNGDNISVLLQGECSKCSLAERCLAWCEERIYIDCNEKVNLIPVRKKPFFWDK